MARFIAVAISALLALRAAAFAADPIPLACAPTDLHTICALEVERNSALNELAITINDKLTLEDEADRKAEYWRRWVAGERRGDVSLGRAIEVICKSAVVVPGSERMCKRGGVK